MSEYTLMSIIGVIISIIASFKIGSWGLYGFSLALIGFNLFILGLIGEITE